MPKIDPSAATGDNAPDVGAASEDAASLGVQLTNLDDSLFDGAGATERDLINYLDGVAGRIIPVLADRPLSVIRVHRGQEAFMQKNLPSYTPAWVSRVTMWAESSKRDVTYALCDDRRSLLWFGNQRAVEYHPALIRLDTPEHMTHLVLDIDPPNGEPFAELCEPLALSGRSLSMKASMRLSRRAERRVCTSSCRSTQCVHRGSRGGDAGDRCTSRAAGSDTLTTAFVKDDRAGKVFVDSTRVGGATVVAAYSPRVRPGAPVSFPLDWDELDDVSPRDFTVLTAVGRLGDTDRWASRMPPPQDLSAELLEEGRASRSLASRRCMRASAGREATVKGSPLSRGLLPVACSAVDHSAFDHSIAIHRHRDQRHNFAHRSTSGS